MRDQNDGRSAFLAGLDRVERVATIAGITAAGLAGVGGLAALAYVSIKIAGNPPPRLGTQGEWAYGALVALLVAGWGVGNALKFSRRLRRRR